MRQHAGLLPTGIERVCPLALDGDRKRELLRAPEVDVKGIEETPSLSPVLLVVVFPYQPPPPNSSALLIIAPKFLLTSLVFAILAVFKQRPPDSKQPTLSSKDDNNSSCRRCSGRVEHDSHAKQHHH